MAWLKLTAASGRMQRRLANGLARFWRDTFSDGWPELRSIIDQDIARRATAIATHGLGRMLGTLHPDIEWAGDAVTIAKPWDGEIDVIGRDHRAGSIAQVATRIGYAPVTVSYHLSALHRAGLVTKVRAGHSVLPPFDAGKRISSIDQKQNMYELINRVCVF